MLEFDNVVKSQRRLMLYLLSILIIGAIITPYHFVLWSLVLGTVASFINLLLMQRQAENLGEVASGEAKAGGLGTLTRIGLMLVVIFTAIRFDALFNLYAVLLGLVTSYAVILVDSLVRSISSFGKPENQDDIE